LFHKINAKIKSVLVRIAIHFRNLWDFKNMTKSGTHPLIDELKSDVEVAFDHFKRTTVQMLDARQENHDASLVILKRSELSVCFDLLNVATQRFSLMNDLYATVIASPSEEVAIEAIYERLREGDASAGAARASAEDYVTSLSEFLKGNQKSENNRKFRHAWQNIEAELIGDISVPEDELRAVQL